MGTDAPYVATSREMSDWATTTRIGWTAGQVGDPFTPMKPARGGHRRPRRGFRRGLRVGLVAAGVALAVGGVSVGAYAAYEKLIGGGGPQPESALPSTTLAFVKVDLDPSGPQKIDAIRFARKFPQTPTEATKDDAVLRQVVFDQVEKSGALSGLDYATDVKPWLGNRFAVALLPGDGSDAPADTVVALAVTDQAKATAGLAKAGSDVHCTVRAAFALCSDSQASVDRAVAQSTKSTLADAKTFSGDMDKIGGDGVLTFWGDLASADRLGTSVFGLGSGALAGATASHSGTSRGRVAGTLRFAGANLELVGRVTALSNPPKAATGTGLEKLPEGTLIGIGMAGAGSAVKQSFQALTSSASPFASDISDFQDGTGISLPDDLVTLLGARTTIAYGGVDGNGDPLLALLTSSPKNQVQGVVGKLNEAGVTPAEQPLKVSEAGGQTVVSLSPSYAATVARGHGLGSSDAFTAALPDADTAQFAAYVDIAGLVSAVGHDMSDADKADVKALRAVGLSVGRDGADATFRLRLTTK